MFNRIFENSEIFTKKIKLFFFLNCSRNKECKLPDPGNVLIFKAFSLGNLKNIKLENKKGLSEYSTDTQI